MDKFFRKWVRKLHRWIAVPTAILIPIAVVIKLSGNPSWQMFLKKFEMVQSLLMLLLAISGVYLYLLPIYMKWNRKRTRKTKKSAK
ncbi:MAG: hypothetical protein DRI56_12805 [Chloroflexota bacterium]|nr:MAG: hypothetical protein DRI56_12805 [Chloroflexota bacterium]